MNSLSQIDNYLLSQKPRQRYILYISAIIFILLLGYILFISDKSEIIEEKDSIAQSKQIELQKQKRNSGLQQLGLLNKQIDKIKNDIVKAQKLASSGLLYTEESPNLKITDGDFAKFLEIAMDFSKKHKVHLSSVEITSEKLPYIGLLEIKKHLSIMGSGRFLDILTLIRYMEKQKFLIRLNSLDIYKINPPEKHDKPYKKYDVNFKVFFEVLGAT